MIQVEHLTKQYGPKTAIADVSFSVAKGEVLAFLGPNGAGKTTTMRILTCFMPATEGTATVAGFDCSEQPQEVKARIGYLPETPPVYQELTVSEYLTFVGRLKGMKGAALRGRMPLVIEQVSLGDVRHRLIANLSRGYRQRVGLAQALLHDPPVLILDEPTVGSSRMRTGGSWISAWASPTRCLNPRERLAISRPRTSPSESCSNVRSRAPGSRSGSTPLRRPTKVRYSTTVISV